MYKICRKNLVECQLVKKTHTQSNIHCQGEHTRLTKFMWQDCFAEADFTNNFHHQIHLWQFFGILHTCNIDKKLSNWNIYSSRTGFLDFTKARRNACWSGIVKFNSQNLTLLHSSRAVQKKKKNATPQWEDIKTNIYSMYIFHNHWNLG